MLEDLWVEPAWQGAGVGSTLFWLAQRSAHELGAQRLEWEAEPNAIGFYTRVGARHIRDTPPNEWGRVLQVMAVDLVKEGAEISSSPDPGQGSRCGGCGYSIRHLSPLSASARQGACIAPVINASDVSRRAAVADDA